MTNLAAHAAIKNSLKFNEMWQFASRLVRLAVMHTN